MKGRETGIRLAQRGPETEGGSRIVGLVILLLYFYMGVYGCVFGFLGVFEIPCEVRMLVAAVLMLGIFFSVVCLSGKYAKYVVILTILAYVWLIYQNWETVLSGGNVALEVIRRVISSYQNGSVSGTDDLASLGREAFVFLLAVIFPWAGILFSGFVFRGGRLFIVMSMAIVLSAVFAVGQVPDFSAACLMLGSLVGAFSTDGLEYMRGQKTGTLLTVILSALLLAVGSAYLAPVLEPWFANEAQLKAQIQNGNLMQELNRRLSMWNTPWATAGIGNGELGNADFVSSTNQRILKVITDQRPEETIYLRCYTGANYTGKKWVELGESMSERAEEAYFESFLMTAEWNGILQPYSMEIQLQEDAGEYDYQPYYSRLDDKNDRLYSYSYYPRVLINQWDTIEPGQLLYEDNYSGFVYQTYTAYEENLLPKLRQVCSSYSPDNLEDLCNFIVDYLDENASYNLSVGRFPEDEDFVEYFLFEKHEGYCVHFATAATLMFRMYGVPARYVTGYVVRAKDFKKNGENYNAWVTDSRAHAWTEIYKDGQGWIPIEVTPGYTQLENAAGQTEQETESERQSESQTQRESEKNAPEKKQEDEETGIPAWVFWILCGLSLAVLAVCGRKQWIVGRRRKEGVKEIFFDVCSVLSLAGFTEEADCQDERFLESALVRFPWLDREAFAALIELAVRANFGKEPVTQEERRFAWEMYCEICREVYRELPAGRKVLFRMYYCFS